MPRSDKAEAQGKRRRVFYAKIDILSEDGLSIIHTAGDVLGLASGGGALEELADDDLIIATFSDNEATLRIGILESYYTPIGGQSPSNVDLTKISRYQSAERAYKASQNPETLKLLLDARDEAITLRPKPGPPI